jgi:malate dehydrogenase (oxaloacetate-decarboxylating)
LIAPHGDVGRPSPQFGLQVDVVDHGDDHDHARLCAIAEVNGGVVTESSLLRSEGHGPLRRLVVSCASARHMDELERQFRVERGADVVAVADRTMLDHACGKLSVSAKRSIGSPENLARSYTPGVARVCESIVADPARVFDYTIKANTVAVVTDGTAVLGLGDIGPEAAMPVMEGKAMLFKEFADVDAFPIALDTRDPDEIVQVVKLIAPTFGGINLEDISSPRCFEIEQRLIEELDIPVFHDDQHGTAIVVLAALINALKIVGKTMEDLRVLVLGLGAAGVACTRMLQAAGVSEIVGCDRRGAISTEREDYAGGEMTSIKRWYAEHTNADCVSGGPNEAIDGCDLLLGLSGTGPIEPSSLARMARDPIVFAMANPTPEVMPDEVAGHVRIMATGRSDFPNQINNVLCFPGIFRGALDTRAPAITEEIKHAAAEAIAAVVADDELAEDNVIPSVFNRDVAPAVAEAVARAAGDKACAQRS